jgi:hypothetical protein
MRFRVRFRPTDSSDWPELIDVFDIPIAEIHYKDEIEQKKQDLQAAFNYLKQTWKVIDIINKQACLGRLQRRSLIHYSKKCICVKVKRVEEHTGVQSYETLWKKPHKHI